MSRREQTKLVEKVAKSIRLSKPGEKNSKHNVKLHNSVSASSNVSKSSPTSQNLSSLSAWKFSSADVDAKKKKLINNDKGFPIRILPCSEILRFPSNRMASFQYYCTHYSPAYNDKVAILLKEATKFLTLFSKDGTDLDIKCGKLRNSAPIHALRSFIWTAVEYQEVNKRSSFPVNAPCEMWIALAKFIGSKGYANYRYVKKEESRFGALLMNFGEVMHIYEEAVGPFLESDYSNRALGKTMSRAGKYSLVQLVDILIEIMPVMDILYNNLNGQADGVDDELAEHIKTIIKGWTVYAYASKQPFFVIPGDRYPIEIDPDTVPNWAEAPQIKDYQDGLFTAFGEEIVSVNNTIQERIVQLPEGITGIVITDDNKEKIDKAFVNVKKVIYPASYSGRIVVPGSVEEIVILGDIECLNISDIAIGKSAKLREIEFKGKVGELGDLAFSGLGNLRTLRLPEGITLIGTYAFSSTKLRELYLPESVEKLVPDAFDLFPTTEGTTIYVYETCPALSKIQKQFEKQRKEHEELNKMWRYSQSERPFALKLKILESPWATRAKSFLNRISLLYDKKNLSEIEDNTVQEILTDTIGGFENFEKCRHYLIADSRTNNLNSLKEVINNTPDNQQNYSSVPERITADIRQSIEKKNREEKERKLSEIKTLSQSNSMSDLTKAITMLEEFRSESPNAEALIAHCTNKLEKIKEERYAQAISLSEEGTETSIKSAILKMEAINPYKDSEDRVKDLHQQLQDERTYMNAVALSDGTVINDLVVAKGLFEKLDNYKDSDAKAKFCDKRIDEIREGLYKEGIAAERIYSLKSQNEAISKYSQLGDYKDSLERKKRCSENCKTIQAIHDLNKEIEEHRKELASLTGAFKKKERQAKETLISTKEQRVNELKDKMSGQSEKAEEKKTEEEKLAEIDVIDSSTETAATTEASASTPAVTIENSTPLTTSTGITSAAPSEPKKKGKGGLIIAVLLIAALAFVGWLAMSGRLGSISQNEDAYVEEEVVQEITPEFTAANVLTIEELDKEMHEDGDGIYVHYKVTNNSDSEIWYFGFSNRYYDKSGNILGENGGSYDGTLGPGKFAYITDSPYFEKKNYDEIETIEVTKYYYNIGNQSYDINLRTNELDSYSGAIDDQKNVDYVTSDIVSITLGDTLALKDGNYVLDVSATNKGKEPLKSLDIYIEYYDEDGNSLARESVGGLDMTLEPGETVKTLGYCWSDYADQAKSFAIVEYEYELNKKDQNGYNHYTINKNVECAYGMEW